MKKPKKAFGQDLEEVYLREKDREKKRIYKQNVLIFNQGFTFDDVEFYAPDGKSFAEYEKITIPIDCVRDEKENEILKYGSEWDKYFDNAMQLNFPMWYHAIEWAWKNKNKPEAERIKQSFKKDYNEWICLGTKFNYDQGNDSIVHELGEGRSAVLDTKIPEDLIWRMSRFMQIDSDLVSFFQALTGKQDISDFSDIMKWASGQESHFATPKKRPRKSAVVIGYGSTAGFLCITCAGGYHGVAREVRVKK